MSANPFAWWADSETLDDVRFATGSMISIDASAMGPELITGMLPDLPPPAHHRTSGLESRDAASPYPLAPAPPRPAWDADLPSGQRSMNGRSAPADYPRPTPIAPSAHAARPDTSREISSHGAPLERGETSYVPAWRVTTGRMPAIIARAETMVAIIRRLMRSSGLYALASLGAPAVSLALTPFLAHYLSVPDYGLLAVLNTSISLFAGLTQLGLGPAFFRAYNYDFTSPDERRSVLATSLLLMAALSGAFLAISLPLAPTLAGLLARGGGDRATQFVVVACLVIAFQNLSVPGFAWLRAEDRALSFSLVSMTNVLVTLGASIALVGYMGAGVTGAMVANGMGYVAVVVGTFIPMLARSRLKFNARVARSMITFGAPLTLSVISVWALQLSDRYLLAYLGDFSQTASYSVAYSLGSVLSTIVLSPFSLAWPTAMYAIAKRSDAPRVFQQVFRWFTAVLLFAAFGLSVASTALLDVLFPPSYRDAAPVIPIVAASIALYGAYTVVMLGANLKRKTWMTSVFTAIAAVINVALNLVLIPKYGSMGAAASTFLAYLALVIIAYIANQRIYPVPYEAMRALFAGLMGIALYYLIAEAPDLLQRQIGPQLLALGLVAPERYAALGLAAAGLLLYGVWLYLLMQIRTIDFRVSPAAIQRLTGAPAVAPIAPTRAEDAYAPR
ncbi:MAG TPA: oligosaccharide flippase family protein [Ktedonobacterales bacterium]